MGCLCAQPRDHLAAVHHPVLRRLCFRPKLQERILWPQVPELSASQWIGLLKPIKSRNLQSRGGESRISGLLVLCVLQSIELERKTGRFRIPPSALLRPPPATSAPAGPKRLDRVWWVQTKRGKKGATEKLGLRVERVTHPFVPFETTRAPSKMTVTSGKQGGTKCCLSPQPRKPVVGYLAICHKRLL